MSEFNALSQCDDLIEAGEKVLRSEGFSALDELLPLTIKLIAIYDAAFGRIDLRQRAALVVAGLADRNDAVLQLVIKNAEQYAKMHHIDDAFPYSPNSFEVLAEAGHGKARVLNFLREIVQFDWGISRWAAIETLCVLNEATADAVLEDVIRGVYPPAALGLEPDLQLIERRKGKEFVDRHRPSEKTSISEAH